MKTSFFAGLFALMFTFAAVVPAQESEIRIVDEVIAQVNDGVITLSRVRREAEQIVETEVQMGKNREDAQREVDAKRGELIANLINEELLIQKAKDMGLEEQVEANINRRFLEIMKQYGMSTVEELYKEMERTGNDPEQIRSNWRKQETKNMVLQREVQSKLFYGLTPKEVKAYYEANKSKFVKPETIDISEIFLSFAGRDEEAVREKARNLVAQLRGGADFQKLLAENSDRPDAVETKGKVDTLIVRDLPPELQEKLKGVKVGEYPDPFEVNQVGVSVVRLDARTAEGADAVFDEDAVRMAILNERAPAAQKEFMATLRQESYIKINESYRPTVAPILFAEERKERAENSEQQ